MSSKYSVGDRVIISDGVRECIYGVASGMFRLIGAEAEIVKVGFSADHNATYYQISLGNPGYKWCDRCFILVEEEIVPVTDDEFSAITEFLSSSH